MKEQELQFRLNDEILENLSRQMKINEQLIERVEGLELAGVKSDEPRNSEPTKKKFEAFYQTNHNNPSFLPMWNYFQEMYSDKPANIEKIKEEFEKTFQTEVETKGTRRVWGNATDVWNFFLPYLSSIGKGDK